MEADRDKTVQERLGEFWRQLSPGQLLFLQFWPSKCYFNPVCNTDAALIPSDFLVSLRHSPTHWELSWPHAVDPNYRDVWTLDLIPPTFLTLSFPRSPTVLSLPMPPVLSLYLILSDLWEPEVSHVVCDPSQSLNRLYVRVCSSPWNNTVCSIEIQTYTVPLTETFSLLDLTYTVMYTVHLQISTCATQVASIFMQLK